tara:strand:+ start:75 stop:425 length:351 start_codon:yes stop_codon:yes gene_type:complete
VRGTEFLKRHFFCALFISCFTPVNAGLDHFSNLIFVDEWLIERKVDSSTNGIKCRASIPLHANWFGARIRLGPTNELIKPPWILVKGDVLIDSKLNKIKEVLRDCRSGPLFLHKNL